MTASEIHRQQTTIRAIQSRLPAASSRSVRRSVKALASKAMTKSSARSKIRRIKGNPNFVSRYTGFFLFSMQRAFWASDVSPAWFKITGINRITRLSMVARRLPETNGIGFKNHCTAAFIADGRVVRTNKRPTSKIISNRQQISTPL